MIEFFRLSENAVCPTKGSEGSAGYDLYAAQDGVVKSGKTLLVKTDLALKIPEGYVGLIRDRSSLGARGVTTFAGVIDSDYRGEVRVCLYNCGYDDYEFNAGERLAQILFIQVGNRMAWVEQTDWDLFKGISGRGTNGFGSTGK